MWEKAFGGVVHERCGDCPGLIIGRPSLLLVFVLHATCVEAEGLPNIVVVIVVRVWF
jgi:hypothetical protein